MAELDNLLLEAAGRTSRKNQAHAGEGSDNSKFNKWKHSGLRLSLKKNLGNGKDRRFKDDESDSALSIGSDLYKDEQVKEDDYPLKKRGMESSTARIEALNELRAKRMRKKEQNSYQMLKDLSDSDYGKEKDNDIDDNLDDLLASNLRPIRYEDVKEITIRRSKLAKWHMEPFFEEIVSGCFVRVGIGRTRNGPKYKLCVVSNVDSTNQNRQYEFEGRTTCKWLNCIWGSEASAARWQMVMVSDSLPTEEEFKEWLREMERNGKQIPCMKEVDEKKEKIQKAETFVYSPRTVKKMIEVKKSSSSRRINFAVEKILLKKSIEKAESAGKEREADRLLSKLEELEDLSRQIKPSDARALRLLEMNRKNRAKNFKKDSEWKPVYTSLKLGEEAYDPSARKWPMRCLQPVSYNNEEITKVVHDTNKLEVAVYPNLKLGEERYDPSARKWTMRPLQSSSAMEEANEEGRLIDTRPPVDHSEKLMEQHNFDLPISLDALNKLGGVEGVQHGILLRKQKIESTIGNIVYEKYGKSNAYTLSINDYKRRKCFLSS